MYLYFLFTNEKKMTFKLHLALKEKTATKKDYVQKMKSSNPLQHTYRFCSFSFTI